MGYTAAVAAHAATLAACGSALYHAPRGQRGLLAAAALAANCALPLLFDRQTAYVSRCISAFLFFWCGVHCLSGRCSAGILSLASLLPARRWRVGLAACVAPAGALSQLHPGRPAPQLRSHPHPPAHGRPASQQRPRLYPPAPLLPAALACRLTNFKLLAWLAGRGPLAAQPWSWAQWVALYALPIIPAAPAGPGKAGSGRTGCSGRASDSAASGPAAMFGRWLLKTGLAAAVVFGLQLDPPAFVRDLLCECRRGVGECGGVCTYVYQRCRARPCTSLPALQPHRPIAAAAAGADAFGMYGMLGCIMDGPASTALGLLGLGLEPHFRPPWQSESIARFWGAQWNRACAAGRSDARAATCFATRLAKRARHTHSIGTATLAPWSLGAGRALTLRGCTRHERCALYYALLTFRRGLLPTRPLQRLPATRSARRCMSQSWTAASQRDQRSVHSRRASRGGRGCRPLWRAPRWRCAAPAL